MFFFCKHFGFHFVVFFSLIINPCISIFHKLVRKEDQIREIALMQYISRIFYILHRGIVKMSY